MVTIKWDWWKWTRSYWRSFGWLFLRVCDGNEDTRDDDGSEGGVAGVGLLSLNEYIRDNNCRCWLGDEYDGIVKMNGNDACLST